MQGVASANKQVRSRPAKQGVPGGTGGMEQHRARILKSALRLLTVSGRDSLTTRAVAEAAQVQPPVLYRLFRDKAKLLEAVAEYGFGLYLARKQTPKVSRGGEDAAEALRQGWRTHVEFGLAYPELYLLMYAKLPQEQPHPVAEQTYARLVTFLTDVAASGRLRLSVQEAAHLCHSASCGTVMTLLNTPSEKRDLRLSELACEVVIAALLMDEAASSPSPLRSAAVTLQAHLAQDSGHTTASELLSPAERNLLSEWLQRLEAGKAYSIPL